MADTKVSKETKEEILWYPAFRLEENPFRYFEAGAEQYLDYMPVIGYSMHEKVRALVSAKVSCLIVGPRGCGKSSLILALREDPDFQVENLEDLFVAVTPKDMSDVYHQFYSGLDDDVRRKMVMRLWRRSQSSMKCWDLEKMRCTLCPRKCRVSEPRGDYYEHYAFFLNAVEPPCPAKEKIFMQALRGDEVSDRTVLLDAPDNLSRRESRELAVLCNYLA